MWLFFCNRFGAFRCKTGNNAPDAKTGVNPKRAISLRPRAREE